MPVGREGAGPLGETRRGVLPVYVASTSPCRSRACRQGFCGP